MRFKILLFCTTLLLLPAVSASAEVRQQVQQSDYWTPARLAAAKPLPVPTPDQTPGDLSDLQNAPAQMVPRGNIIEDNTAYPARTMGTLFGVLPIDGQPAYSFRCSATSLAAPAGDLVLTAGHCIDSPQTKSTAVDLVFIPGYRDGEEPYGEWHVSSFITTPQWEATYQTGPDFANDLAILTVEGQASADGGDHSLSEVVGALSPAFNTPRAQTYQQYGYPATAPYDGNHLYELDAPYIGDDIYQEVPKPIGVSSDFTPGSSGGAWLSNGLIVGINSFYYPEDPAHAEQMYSPYFGNNAQNLYAAAGGNVPTLPPDQLPPPEASVPPSNEARPVRTRSEKQGRPPGHQFLKISKIEIDKDSGTALVSTHVPGAGQLKLQGWHMYTQKKLFPAAETVTLKVKLKPGYKDSRLLNKNNHRWVVIALSYRKNKHDRLFLSHWVKLVKRGKR